MLLALCCLTFTPQPANNYIDWAAIEQYTLYDYQYEYGEQSGMVGMLQHWLNIEIDNIYGQRTHRAHRQEAMQNGKQLPLYDINRSIYASIRATPSAWITVVPNKGIK